jgi:hypothetical protein
MQMVGFGESAGAQSDKANGRLGRAAASSLQRCKFSRVGCQKRRGQGECPRKQ